MGRIFGETPCRRLMDPAASDRAKPCTTATPPKQRGAGISQMTSSLAVIVLNYKRPQNIAAITLAARSALPNATIFVLDQAQDETHQWRDVDPQAMVWLRRSPRNDGAGARVLLASHLPFTHYIAIDDDTFLTPGQISRLAELLQSQPDRAHGIWGQRFERVNGGIQANGSLIQVNAPVSILNRVYAFTRSQATAAIALSARLGFASWRDIGPTDDILLSCAASKPPLVHALGPFEQCATSNTPGVAVWKTEGFSDRRVEVCRRLLELKALFVFERLPD